MTHTPLTRRAWLVAAGGLAAAGCSDGPRNAPVDTAKARDTLKAALESWKRGEKAEQLQSASPPIFVIDQEWQAGVALKDYKILGDGIEQDALLSCPVRLTTRPAGGGDTTREVTFLVSTAPNLTVSRKVF